MLHLSTDRLAALGDETPTRDEAAHLASCEACAAERAAYATLVAMAAADRTSLGVPLTRWEAIAAALDADASPADGQGSTRVVRARRSHRGWAARAAAAVLLLAGGVVAGRASAGASLVPVPRGANVLAGAAPANVSVASTAARETGVPDSAFASIEEARAAQRRSEQMYQQAVAYLARFDSAAVDDGSPVAVRSRLAALDRVISATSEAMREAPHDPVINGYYLTTLGQREATIRQLSTVLPASLRLDSF